MRVCSVRLIVALSICLTAAFAQAGDTQDLLTGYSVTTWNEGDGRPFGAVYTIVQDRLGYLWIGADAGLFRFDGSRFTISDDINDAPLPKAGVTALSLSRDGTLWVGFADDSAVRRIRGGHVEALPRTNAPMLISDLAEDRRGDIWAVGDGTLYQFKAGAWHKAILAAAGRDARVRQVFVRSNGDILAATWLGTFERRESLAVFERMSPNVSWGVTEDSEHRIWTTDIAHGFRRLLEDAAGDRSGAGYRVMFDRQGKLWVATYGAGLWRVSVDGDARQRTIYRAGLRTGLSSDLIQAVFEDRDGNIWVGTSGGLHRLMRRRLTPLEDLGYAIAVAPDARDGMWVGTTTGVIRVAKEPDGWGRVEPISSNPDVRSLYDDHRGTLWIGAIEGLFRFASGRLTQVALPPRARRQIMSIAPAQDGSLWLGDGAWLFRWDGYRLIPFDQTGDAASFGHITYSQMDRRGRLWIASDAGRLGFVDLSGMFHRLGPADGFGLGSHDVIHAVYEDTEGDIWIGASGGLGRFKAGRYNAIGREQGLFGGQVWSVVADASNRLWLSVDRGLVCLDRHEFDNAVNMPRYRVQYRVYDTLDGLAGGAFGHVSSERANDGTLWFIQGGGLTRVNPGDIREDFASMVAPLHIESVLTSNERVLAPTSEMAFPHGIGRLQINYAAVVLTAPNKIRFRYRLDGVDSNWVAAGTQRAAFYTNLSPGKYHFQVEASAEEGVWTTSKADWSFTIKPAFYQTMWFYAMALTTALFAVWAVWRVRIGIVKHEFSLVLAERVRVSRELHDTLLQSLVGVVLQLEPIAKTVVLDPIAARNQINRVRRQVEAYVREARESIKNLRSPSLKVRSLATALQEFGREAVAHTSVTFHTELMGTAAVSSEVEAELFRIGQEAITNAIRHASASQITLLLHFTDQFARLRVSDDGCGFQYNAQAVPDDHYGLITMKERAEELGGTLTIVSVPGNGTFVEVTVPAEQIIPRSIPA